MITLKKIRTLKERVQIRKCGSLMYEEARFHAFDDEYIDGLKAIVNESPIIAQKDKAELSMLYEACMQRTYITRSFPSWGRRWLTGISWMMMAALILRKGL